ncbi:MAG: L,D-transpeptidase family protein, partial [Alphaproteobacteria bacterium]
KFYMAPGIDNLLGGVRFSLTNDQAIYLHDSPERDRFGDGVRSFSSGCVRVGDSATLASWIMGRQKNWKRTDVIAAMVKGETRIEVLPHPIPFDFIYSTVGMKEDGMLVFKPDIYGEDAKLGQKLGLRVNDVPPPLPKQRR